MTTEALRGAQEEGDSKVNRMVRTKRSPKCVAAQATNGEVEVRDAGQAGRGLFAVGYLPYGFVVARMIICVKSRRSTVEAHLRDNGLPEDAAVEVMLSDVAYYDETFTNWDQKPLWYFMNHACKPNCEMALLYDEVCWKTKNDILPNEELTFGYDDPHPTWCGCVKDCQATQWHWF